MSEQRIFQSRMLELYRRRYVERKLFLFLLLAATAMAQTMTTYTGTIKDLSQQIVTSGQGTFTLALANSSSVPTLSTGSTNYGDEQGSPIPFLGTWSSSTAYQVGQAVAYNKAVYISLTAPNLNNTPSSSPSNWSLVVSPASVLAAPSGTQTIVQPGTTSFNINATQSGTANGVINPASCGWTTGKPSWCAGSEMGAWINSAIAALPGNGAGGSFGCGVVQLPYNSLYNFTTPIVKPRCTLIDLNQSSIGYTGSVAFPAVSIWDTFDVSEPAQGGIINGRIFGGTGFSPIVSGSIGVMMGGLLTPTSGYCLASNTSLCSATFQTFSNLGVVNFTDGFRVGSNSYINNWQSVSIAANTNGMHFLAANNSGENQNFQGSYFINNQAHDILVDPGGYVEVNMHSGSFDYTGTDSIVGTIHFSASDIHVENNNLHWHFINCTAGGCSINIKGGQILDLSGPLASTDSFAVFSGTNNQATFDGVEWGILAGDVLSQFFVWNDSSSASSLRLVNFRQATFGILSTASLRNVPLFSGAQPPLHQSNASATEAAQVVPASGDIVIASGASSLEGIYSIDLTEKNSRSSMVVSVDASGGDTGYSMSVLSSYCFNASSGSTFPNLVNPRVVTDSFGLPQLVVTLVSVASSANLTVVRYGNPAFLPALLSGASVGATAMTRRAGIMQDALGNFSFRGTLNISGGLLPLPASTSPTGTCPVKGALFNDSTGHLSLCDSTGNWFLVH